ncbi:MAG TPA: site-2 protease family protein [Candidatus Limnocylindrales bacterium]|nr:site-2 protease family protein [Candidatus Limnocylindrales bacterium]
MARSGGGIPVGSILGVRIQVHPSWLVIFVLVVLSLASVGTPEGRDDLAPALNFARAVIVALLFFACVLVHELAHAFVARRKGIQVSEITLFIFGGAANLEQEAPNARAEALIAAAGPASSIVLAGGFLVLAAALRGAAGEPARLVGGAASWLGSINLLLALFNLVPGFPMDGGRLLRALLWGVTRDFVRATRIATLIGRGFAYLLIGGGFFLALQGSILDGLWLAFIGWFLNQAAESSYRRVAVENLVRGVLVRDVMDREVPVVGPNLTLDTFVQQHLLAGRAPLYPVVIDGDLMGTIELAQVSRVPREDWPTMRVTDVMTRGPKMVTLTEPQPLWEAISHFEESGTQALPVVDGETKRRLLGLVTQEGVFRALRARRELTP